MINILKLRKLEKGKNNQGEISSSSESNDNEVISLDKTTSENEEKNKTSKDNKKKTSSEKTKKSKSDIPPKSKIKKEEIEALPELEVIDEQELTSPIESIEKDSKDFNLFEKMNQEESEQTEALRRQLLAELDALNEEPVVNIQVEDENPDLYGLNDEFVNEIKDLADTEEIEDDLFAKMHREESEQAEALRRQLLAELDALNEEPANITVEDENPDLYGLDAEFVNEINELKEDEPKNETVAGLSPEELAEKKRKEEILKKFLSKTTPRKDDPEEETSENNQSDNLALEEDADIKIEQTVESPKEEKIEQKNEIKAEIPPVIKQEIKIEQTKEEKNEAPLPVKKQEFAISSSEQHEESKVVGERTIQLIGFLLGKEIFGFDINNIREINRIANITKVPNVPEYIDGVINLRGNVIPIINLRTKTKMPKKEFDSKTRIIIIENENMVVGFIVDEVKEVLRIPESIIMPPPAIAVTETSEYISSVARTENGLIILLDIGKLLSREDFGN